MSANSTDTTDSSPSSTETSKTAATTRETHLRRVELLAEIIGEAANRAMPLHFTVQSGGMNCESLRWLIARERGVER